MNVLLHSLHLCRFKGGVERVVADLANFLAAGGHRVSVVVKAKEGAQPLYPLVGQVELHCLDFADSPESREKLRQLVATLEPDVIYCPHQRHLAPMFLEVGMAEDVPVVLAEHADPLTATAMYENHGYRSLFSQAAAAVHLLLPAYASTLPEVPAERLFCIPNPTPVPDEPPTLQADARPRIISVGRLENRHKRLCLLVEAFGQLAQTHPDWDLVIFGEGEERRALERQINQLGLSKRIKLPGLSDRILDELKASAIYCTASISEGCSIAIEEAQAAGLPVVGFGHAAGVNVQVQDGVTGILVDSLHSADKLAQGLDRLMGDGALRTQLGRRAHAHAREQYETVRVMGRLTEMLEQAVVMHADGRTDPRREAAQRSVSAYCHSTTLGPNSRPHDLRHGRRLIAEFRARARQAKVVSFDVFDTLLVRRCKRPTDLFRAVELDAGLPGFADARISTEQELRKRSNREVEVHLDEIYAELATSNPEFAALKEKEMAFEKKFLVAHPEIRRVYETAREMGLRIVAVSDTYLPRELVGELLASCGYEVDELFVSSESGDRKANGRLFQRVIETLNEAPQSILHIGDSYDSDYAQAIRQQIPALHWPSIGSEFEKVPAANVALVELANDSLLASIVVGSLAIHWCAQGRPAEPQSSGHWAGWTWAGPLVLAFVGWVRKQAEQDGVQALAFLARDMQLPHAIYQALWPDSEAYYLPSSRRLFLLPLAADGLSEAVLDKLTQHALPQAKDYITRLDLDPGIEKRLLDDPTLPRAEGPRLQQQMRAFFRSHESVLQEAGRAERELLVESLRGLPHQDDNQLAIVDVGWLLSAQRGMDTLLSKRFPGYYMGVLPSAYDNGKIRGWLFHYGEPVHSRRVVNGVLLEFLLGGTESSTIRFTRTTGGSLEVVRVPLLPDEAIRQRYHAKIQAGAMEFLQAIEPILSSFFQCASADEATRFFAVLSKQPQAWEYRRLGTLPNNNGLGSSNQYETLQDSWSVPAGGLPDTSPRSVLPARAPSREALRREEAWIRTSGLFDSRWYRKQYPEVAQSDVDPLRHFLETGVFQGYRPSAQFDPHWYCTKYPEAVRSGMNPLTYYIRKGKAKGHFSHA